MSVPTLPRCHQVPVDPPDGISLLTVLGSTENIHLSSSVAITDDERIFMFGGFDKFTDEMDNNVKVLDLQTGEWTKRASANPYANRFVPTARCGHTSIFHRGKVIVYGGEEENTNATSSIFYYDLDRDEWTPVEEDPEEELPRRSRHAACISEDGTKLVISGGLDEHKQVSNEIYVFDLVQETWSSPIPFVARFDHSIIMHNNRLWAFGGFTPERDRVSEVTWYDFETDTIGTVNITAQSPSSYSSGTSTGVRFYGSGVSGTMLEVVTPGPIGDTSGSRITCLDMDAVNWRSLMEDCSEHFASCHWYHMIAHGTKVILLGHPVETGDVETSEEVVTKVLTIDLSNYGYLEKSGLGPQREQLGTIGHDMYKFYKESQMCDFEVTAIAGDERPEYHVLSAQAKDYAISGPIPVHMAVLAARWPHFKRIVASGMAEFQTRRLHIPEPLSWVRRLVEYMYRDSIEGCTVEEAMGLLILSNLYELPRLRKLCLEFVSQASLNHSDIVSVWRLAGQAHEPVLRRNAAMLCMRRWGQVVRSEQFAKLNREELIELCQEADERSFIRTTSSSVSKTVAEEGPVLAKHEKPDIDEASHFDEDDDDEMEIEDEDEDL